GVPSGHETTPRVDPRRAHGRAVRRRGRRRPARLPAALGHRRDPARQPRRGRRRWRHRAGVRHTPERPAGGRWHAAGIADHGRAAEDRRAGGRAAGHRDPAGADGRRYAAGMSQPEHEQTGEAIAPVPTDVPYAPEGSAYHPGTPDGVEGDAYAEGGAEYEALQRAEQDDNADRLPATDDEADDERQYNA